MMQWQQSGGYDRIDRTGWIQQGGHNVGKPGAYDGWKQHRYNGVDMTGWKQQVSTSLPYLTCFLYYVGRSGSLETPHRPMKGHQVPRLTD